VRPHWVRLGQQPPGGGGAMEPSLHLSRRHLTWPQSVTEHWLDRGQHSALGMGAREPSSHTSGWQSEAFRSQSAIGHRAGSGQQWPGERGARSPLGQSAGPHSSWEQVRLRLSRHSRGSGQQEPGGTGATDPSLQW